MNMTINKPETMPVSIYVCVPFEQPVTTYTNQLSMDGSPCSPRDIHSHCGDDCHFCCKHWLRWFQGHSLAARLWGRVGPGAPAYQLSSLSLVSRSWKLPLGIVLVVIAWSVIAVAVILWGRVIGAVGDFGDRRGGCWKIDGAGREVYIWWEKRCGKQA